MLRYIIISTILLMLTGCELFSSNPAPIVLGCPALKDYSADEQKAQAQAEAALPANSPLAAPLLEWGDLRAQLKLCQTQPGAAPLPPDAAPVAPVKKSFFGTSL